MGFFSALARLFSSKPKTRSAKSTSKQASASKKRKNAFAPKHELEDAARFTLDLVDGITGDQRVQATAVAMRLSGSAERGSQADVAQDILKIFGDADWHWKEWDYWQPRCVSEHLWGYHMMFCSPYPDELDWEKERGKIKPETLINPLKAQEAKDLVSPFVPEGEPLKTKASALNFLKNRKDVFETLRDRRIQDVWDSKPHRLVATREEIATLMAWTIWDRMNYLSDVNDMTKLGAKSKISFVEDHDKRFYEVASNDRKNPWKHKDILPNFPGGMVMVFMA